MKNEFKRLFSKEVKHIKFKSFCSDVFKYLESLGIYCEIDDMNGWQGDYWSRFTYEGMSYCISGCMYDGMVNVEIDEEE